MEITFQSCSEERHGYLVRFKVAAGDQETVCTTVVAVGDAAGLDADGLLARAWRQVEPTLGEEFRAADDAQLAHAAVAVALALPDLAALEALEGQPWVPPVAAAEETPEAPPEQDTPPEPAPVEKAKEPAAEVLPAKE